MDGDVERHRLATQHERKFCVNKRGLFGVRMKKGAKEEDLRDQQLTKLPDNPEWSKVTIVRFDKNFLTHKSLKTLCKQSPLLVEISATNNHIVKLPHELTKLKKLKVMNFENNPIAYPLMNAKLKNNWKKALFEDKQGRRSFRMYFDEVDGVLQYADVEIVVMGEKMYPQKDEDRSDVKIGLLNDEVQTLQMHDRDKQRFGGPDETIPPWYRQPSKKKVFPTKFVNVGVFDGHGGSFVSTALKQHMFKFIEKHNLLEPQEDMEQKVKEMYEALDKALIEKTEEAGKFDGSTCVNMFFSDKFTVISHVGDSRCVLGLKNSEVIQVTKDHDPEVPEEKEMVEKKGGVIASHAAPRGGVIWRVNSDLAMTRSFGDRKLKEFISCIPDVDIRENIFKDKVDSFVVATDGLWHHCESEKSIEIVRKSVNCEEAANALYKLLRQKISQGKNKVFGIDNTMICVGKIRYGTQRSDVPKLNKPT